MQARILRHTETRSPAVGKRKDAKTQGRNDVTRALGVFATLRLCVSISLLQRGSEKRKRQHASPHFTTHRDKQSGSWKTQRRKDARSQRRHQSPWCLRDLAPLRFYFSAAKGILKSEKDNMQARILRHTETSSPAIGKRKDAKTQGREDVHQSPWRLRDLAPLRFYSSAAKGILKKRKRQDANPHFTTHRDEQSGNRQSAIGKRKDAKTQGREDVHQSPWCLRDLAPLRFYSSAAKGILKKRKRQDANPHFTTHRDEQSGNRKTQRRKDARARRRAPEPLASSRPCAFALLFFCCKGDSEKAKKTRCKPALYNTPRRAVRQSENAKTQRRKDARARRRAPEPLVSSRPCAFAFLFFCCKGDSEKAKKTRCKPALYNTPRQGVRQLENEKTRGRSPEPLASSRPCAFTFLFLCCKGDSEKAKKTTCKPAFYDTPRQAVRQLENAKTQSC